VPSLRPLFLPIDNAVGSPVGEGRSGHAFVRLHGVTVPGPVPHMPLQILVGAALSLDGLIPKLIMDPACGAGYH